jgi:hypothetical protein
MAMFDEKNVMCGASAYEQKYYFNPVFHKLPQQIKDELQIMCVLFTEDVGGVLTLVFDEDGSLKLVTESEEEDLLYDEIGAALKIKQLQVEKQELFDALEQFWKEFICC